MSNLEKFLGSVQLFADGARVEDIVRLSELDHISGFTTNPSLMAKAGVLDYLSFAREACKVTNGKGLSLEVISDQFDQMYTEAKILASLSDNIFVKIPITNTKGESSAPLIRELSLEKVNLNITAIFTLEQYEVATNCFDTGSIGILSVFAGRIADTGIDPVPLIKKMTSTKPKDSRLQTLWASTREVINIEHAIEAGCEIVTVTPDILDKLNLIGKPLEDYSLETVKMFLSDAENSRFEIK